MFINLDLFAGTRVSGHAPFSLLGFETPESADFDISPLLQRFNDCLDEPINHRLSFDLCETGTGCYVIDDISFCQSIISLGNGTYFNPVGMKR